MKLKSELVRCKDLKQGDMFTHHGPEVTNNIPPGAVGFELNLRLDGVLHQDDEDKGAYRITIVREMRVEGLP